MNIPINTGNLKFDPDTRIGDLPGIITLKLRNVLDTGPDRQNWRAWVAALDNHPDFKIEPHERERMALAIHGNDSPTDRLLLLLGSRDMNVEQLTQYMEQLRIESILLLLKNYEPIRITQMPRTSVSVTEGQTLELEVVATGLPFPRYQWFKCVHEEFEEVEAAIESILRISNIRQEHAGTYCCRLHNSEDLDQVKFTEPYSKITVIPDSNSDSDPNTSSSMSREENIYTPTKVSPLPVIRRHPVSVTVNIGQEFVLSCEASGYPPLKYLWYKDDESRIETEKPYLKYPQAMPDCSGEYFCKVKNAFGEAVSEKAYVSVNQLLATTAQREIEFISNPKSCTVEFGGSAAFSVEARGACESLRYYWYKNGSRIPGSIKPTHLVCNIQSAEEEGMYQCLVECANNSAIHRLSNGAVLSLRYPHTDVRPEYNPTDKVALLIGNYDYRNETQLKAPITDVQVMAESFRELDFKVVSLLNLTKQEMLAAVGQFRELLDQGVYAVFYFCGHGFEEDGCCYLVPPDARAGYETSDCLCADDILNEMRRPDPALICLILDICRQQNKNKIQNADSKGQQMQMMETKHRGNTIICYATSLGMNAFEDRTNGILVKYLQQFIRKPLGIEDMFSRVREEFGRAHIHSHLQLPQNTTNLLEPRRSLADKISTRGNTCEFRRRTIKWQNAHLRPKEREIFIEKLNVVIKLEFQSDFSNVLHVFTTVKKPGVTSKCIAYITNWPPTVSLMGNSIKMVQDNPAMTKTILQDLQKLQSNLVVNVAVKYCFRGQNQECIYSDHREDLGLPLVAILNLWQYPAISQRLEPMEQEEDASLE